MSKDYKRYCQFIFICKGSDCKKNGGKQLMKAFNKELKATGGHKSTMVFETKCMNRCKEAPAIVVGQQWMTKVKENQVKDIIAENIKP